jgi:hypothetical protein
MDNFNLVSIATVVLSLVTGILLVVWSNVAPRSRPYSWLAAIWAFESHFSRGIIQL